MPDKSTEQALQATERRAELAQNHSGKPRTFTSKEVWQALRGNEHGEAYLLQRAMAGLFCFDCNQKTFFCFKDGYWQEDIKGEALAFVHDTMEQAYKAEVARQTAQAADKGPEEAAKTPEEAEAAVKAREKAGAKADEIRRRIKSLSTYSRSTAILKLTQTGKNSINISGDNWNADPYLLQAQGTVIQLRDGTTREGRPEDYINKVAPTAWKGLQAPCPNWQAFILSIFDGDTELAEYMQKALGAALIGKPVTREFYICVGAGSNGKSTLFETVKEVLGGDLAGPIKSDLVMDDKRGGGGKADPELLALNGMRIVWVNETKKNEKLDTEQIKQFTGNDSLTGRYNYANKVLTFSPTHTLFLLTNNKPKIAGGGQAIWDRLRLIEYKIRFVDEPNEKLNEKPKDKGLADRLKQEKSGILAWLVQGCIAYQKHGLKAPASVMANSDSYRLDQDLILEFMQERCVLGTGQVVQSKPLYDAFCDWYRDTYGDGPDDREIEIPIKHKSFTRDVRERPGIRYDGKGRLSYFHGIGLVEGPLLSDAY